MEVLDKRAFRHTLLYQTLMLVPIISAVEVHLSAQVTNA